jgi:peptide deformylase
MIKKILQREEKVLRKIAKDVPLKDIKGVKIKKILKEMSESLKSQSDGVAIAAPQIGYSMRIFVVAGRIFTEGLVEPN